jgi:hypothetical protein
MPLTKAKIRDLRSVQVDRKAADCDGLQLLLKRSGSRNLRFKVRVQGNAEPMAFGSIRPSVRYGHGRFATRPRWRWPRAKLSTP